MRDLLDALDAVPTARRIVRPNDAKILTLDIERFKGTFTGEFWDLNDFKNRRIQPDMVVEWPRTICVAWRWYGQKRVEFHAEWDDDGREGMLRAAWHAYDQADIIVGHNLAGFDTKKLKSDWNILGLGAPRPWKTVDTLSIARREFGFESNQLGSLCERMGVPGKVDHYDVEVARAALAGDRAAQRRLKRYNIGDIEASEALYDAMRGWIPAHPFIGTRGDEKVCNQCGSDDLNLQPSRYRAVVLDYALYRCGSCAANVRGGWVARAASTRGAR
jgi:hypothetical protein